MEKPDRILRELYCEFLISKEQTTFLGKHDTFVSLSWQELLNSNKPNKIIEILELNFRNRLRISLQRHFYHSTDHPTYCLNEDVSKDCESTENESTTKNYGASFFHRFFHAVQELEIIYQNSKEMYDLLNALSSNLKLLKSALPPFHRIIQSALVEQLPVNFYTIISVFYETAFKIFMSKNCQYSKEIVSEASVCKGCCNQFNSCCCDELLDFFHKTNKAIKSMNLLDRFSRPCLVNLIKSEILSHINHNCQGIYNTSHLSGLKEWLENVVLTWLKQIFEGDATSSDISQSTIIKDFNIKLTFYLYETYSRILIDQFFNIIIDFPDSVPVIDDLKECLKKIDLRKSLIETLTTSLETRILHAGVDTMDILIGYVAAIKTIRYLDSSDIILDAIMTPVKEYLRNRSDTVRKVVMGLTEDGPTDLADELAKSENLNSSQSNNQKADVENWELWQPDQLETCLSSSSIQKTSRSADIITMIVNIYGSKELFVNEYRNLLADRLLTQLTFTSEKEIRNIELLKLRFGDALLHSCEVMLKDISDSKRINAHIKSNQISEDTAFDISALIISSQFWPSFNKDVLELPKEIEDEFKKYTKNYEAYKGNRTLNWRYVTGRVDVEIEFPNRTLEFSVSPIHAVVLYYFQHKNIYTLEELSSFMKVPPTVLRRKMSFWQSHGVIAEHGADTYRLIEEAGQANYENQKQAYEMGEEENETAMASVNDQRQEELQVFWSYIVGMLTNLDSLPLERIHQMLKLFASHGPGIEFSSSELKHFLQTKVREHKLVFARGVYQLPK